MAPKALRYSSFAPIHRGDEPRQDRFSPDRASFVGHRSGSPSPFPQRGDAIRLDYLLEPIQSVGNRTRHSRPDASSVRGRASNRPVTATFSLPREQPFLHPFDISDFDTQIVRGFTQ